MMGPGRRQVGMNTIKTFIIAEAGVNHNGSMTLAKQLIDAAASSGADAVKFQTFKSEQVVSAKAVKAAYQLKATDSAESQLDMIKKLEFSFEQFAELKQYCDRIGIQFLSTPFDLESLAFLVEEMRVPLIKIPSGEITNAPLLLRAARSGKPIILSTGMCDIGDIQEALAVLSFGYQNPSDHPEKRAVEDAYASEKGRSILRDKLTLLHCTTEYPAPYDEVNLNAILSLGSFFGLPVGYSDHTEGIVVPIAAVAKGATVIEKHFTVDKTLEGPDHKASLDPEELKEMVKSIRIAERAMGDGVKAVTPSESKNREIARKSLIAGQPIRAGELFTEVNVAIKRPGYGISPMRYYEVIGKRAVKDFEQDEVIVDGTVSDIDLSGS